MEDRFLIHLLFESFKFSNTNSFYWEQYFREEIDRNRSSRNSKKKKKNKRTLYNPAVEIHQPTKIIIKRAGAPKYPNTNSEKAHSILWYITVYLEKRLKNIPRRRAVQLRC